MAIEFSVISLVMLSDFLAFNESHTTNAASVLQRDFISMDIVRECADKIVTSKVMVHEKVSRIYPLIDLRREILIR